MATKCINKMSNIIQMDDGKIVFNNNLKNYGEIKATKYYIHLKNNVNIKNYLKTKCLKVKENAKIYNLEAQNINIAGNLNVQGIIDFGDADSINLDTGAIILKGGMAIHKNVNIGKNLNVMGNVCSNNLVQINNLNNGSEVGYIFKKNVENTITKKENMKGIIINSGVNNMRFGSDLDIKIGSLIKIAHQFSINEVRQIIGYDSDNKIITFDKDLNSDFESGEYFYIYDNMYSGMCYDENNNKIVFAKLQNLDASNLVNTMDIHANNCTFDGVATALEFTTLSDERLKKDIRNVDCKEMEKIIKDINVVKYKLKNEKQANDQIGFIAQQIERVESQLVKTNKNGIKSVAYSKLTPILTSIIQDLLKRIEYLESGFKKIDKINL